MKPELLGGTALFDKTEKYRYRLARKFSGGKLGTCTFIMLNPSTATADVSDPTVRRCEGYAKRWGYSALWVVNIFALRSTDPKKLYTHPDPVGPENDQHILEAVRYSDLAIAAWGTHGDLHARGESVMKLLSAYSINCLGITKGGHPKHPLYLKQDLKPFIFMEVA
jgi:hypothetical protein